MRFVAAFAADCVGSWAGALISLQSPYGDGYPDGKNQDSDPKGHPVELAAQHRLQNCLLENPVRLFKYGARPGIPEQPQSRPVYKKGKQGDMQVVFESRRQRGIRRIQSGGRGESLELPLPLAAVVSPRLLIALV